MINRVRNLPCQVHATPLRGMQATMEAVKDVLWCCLPQHDAAVMEIKRLVTAASIQRYYDVAKPVTIQSDASQKDLSYSLPLLTASKCLMTMLLTRQSCNLKVAYKPGPDMYRVSSPCLVTGRVGGKEGYTCSRWDLDHTWWMLRGHTIGRTDNTK